MSPFVAHDIAVNWSPCQVPRFKRPSVIGTVTEDPTSEALVCDTLGDAL